MALSAGSRVRIADVSSGYRGMSGEIQSIDGTTHRVRLDGHGCNQTVDFLVEQLRGDTGEIQPVAAYVDYSKC